MLESEPRSIDIPAQTVAAITARVPMADLRDFFDRSFGELGATLAAQQVGIVGPPFARYAGVPTESVDITVGFPTDRAVDPAGSVAPGELPAGRVCTAVHVGSYAGLGASWGELAAWMGARGLTPAEAMWEVYVTEPSPEIDSSTLRTELFWPITG